MNRQFTKQETQAANDTYIKISIYHLHPLSWQKENIFTITKCLWEYEETGTLIPAGGSKHYLSDLKSH